MPCPPLPTTAPGSLQLLFLFQLRPGALSGEERDALLLHLLREPGLSSVLERREPETQRQSLGAKPQLTALTARLKDSPHSTKTQITQNQHKSIYPFCFSLQEGRSIALPASGSFSTNANPKGSTGTRVCENGPFIHPYTPYGPNLP